MASDADDNPFARNSTWPRMPQAPFRVGPLPKASPMEPGPNPATITPVFVRPLEPAPAAPVMSGAAVPRAVHRPVAAPEPPPPTPAPVEIELAPVIVQPYRKPRSKPARSHLPAIAATVVGLAGVIGLALLLSRAQQAVLRGPTVPPPPAAGSAVIPEAPPVAMQPDPKRPAPSTAPLARLAPPPPRPETPRAAVVRAITTPAPDVSAATEEMLGAPALSLTPAPPPAVYTPPAAVDPSVPVATRAPYS